MRSGDRTWGERGGDIGRAGGGGGHGSVGSGVAPLGAAASSWGRRWNWGKFCGEVSLPVIRGVWLAFFLDGIYCVQRVTVLAIVVYFVGDFECTLVRSMYLAKFDS